MNLIGLAQYLSSFGASWLWSAIFGAILSGLTVLATIELDLFFILVLTVFLWAMLLLAARRYLVLQSIGLLKRPGDQSPLEIGTLQRGVGPALHTKNPTFPWSLPNALDSKELSLESAQHVMQEAENEMSSWYIPVQALVWSLPAVGFVGTAWRLRGIAYTLQLTATASSNKAQVAPPEQVEPMIAIAFSIVILALTCAVIAHTVTALCIRSEMVSLQRLQNVLTQLTKP